MRTAIFFGLMSIASAISAQTGYIMSSATITFSSIVLFFLICFDFIEVFKIVR